MTKSKPATSKLDKYDSFILEIMKEKLFAGGSELSQVLAEKFDVTQVYARKILNRITKSGTIDSSSPYTFGKGQFIYTLPGRILDANTVMEVCIESRPPIYRLLQAMQQNDGVISHYDAMKITASPIEGSSTKVSTLRDIIKILSKLNLLEEKLDDNGVRYLFSKESVMSGSHSVAKLMSKCYSDILTDAALLNDIIRWLVKSNIAVKQFSAYRNKKTPALGILHNGLLWDAISYTNTTGINPGKASTADTKEKQTLVVLDVLLSSEYSQVHLDGFYNRIQINLNSVKSGKRKVLPIVVYKECDEIILSKMRKLGFVALDIASVFGTKIYAIIESLAGIVNGSLNQERIEQSVQSILTSIRAAGQEDALKDLKGILFEVLMYPMLSNFFPNSTIDRNKIIKGDEDGQTKSYEYDYIIRHNHPKEIVVVELKGYAAKTTISLGDDKKKNSLKWFYERAFKFIKQYYKKDISEGYALKAVYITSATFHADGRAFVDTMNKSRMKPSKLNVAYERENLLTLLKDNGFKNEVKIIEKYYAGEVD